MSEVPLDAPWAGGLAGAPQWAQETDGLYRVPGAARRPPYKSAAVDDELFDCLGSLDLRRASRPGAFAWLLLQALFLTAQAGLLWEVSSNLAQYRSALQEHCGPAHQQHGVCVGPLWSMVAFKSFDAVHGRTMHLEFTTASDPPTFVVVVAPRPLDRRFSYGITVTRPDTRDTYSRNFLHGTHASVILDDSGLGVDSGAAGGTQRWSVDVRDKTRYAAGQSRLRVTDDEGQTAPSRPLQQYAFDVYVEDANIPHLAEVRSNPACSFEGSWRAFSETALGRGTSSLAFLERFLLFSLTTGAATCYLVWRLFGRQTGPDGAAFHWILAAKWLLQDMPFQVMFLVYAYQWYSESGERCQMCLLDPAQCGSIHPFHPWNLLVLMSALASACAHQLLVRAAPWRATGPKPFGLNDNDDVLTPWMLRVCLVCVSTLPFTTAMMYFNAWQLYYPLLVHFLLGMPCVLGWATLFCMLCCPLIYYCEE